MAGSGDGSGGDSVRVGELSVLLSSVNSSKRMHIYHRYIYDIYVCYLCICRNAGLYESISVIVHTCSNLDDL